MKTPHSVTLANGRIVGGDEPTYVIAEVSANHNGSLETARELVRLAAECGADAVKLQTYTAETITLDCYSEAFIIKGTIWSGRRLFDLYREAFTPWEWHEALFTEAAGVGIDCFSTPFDTTAVDFLERFNPPAYKIASFEVVDIPLLEAVGRTGRPVILSTGMASLSEIEEATNTLRRAGTRDLILLKCTSSYPATAREANVRTIPHLGVTFGAVAGLSDHTMGDTVAVTAVALGARVVEKHFCRSRSEAGPDSSFSMEPAEFRAMVDAIRTAEQSFGCISYELTESERVSRKHRKSLFVAEDVAPGESFTAANVRCVRPADGLHPRYLKQILGRCAAEALPKGTPLRWEHIR